MDSLRAVAALAIVWGHVLVTTQGPIWFPERALGSGVTVFFVISGFLLYRPFAAASLGGARAIRLRDYARRRLLRIVPAYWFALTVLTIAPGLTGLPGRDWWIYYGLAQNYADRTRTTGIPQAWSLSVEFTFYCLLPLLALALATVASAAPRARGRVALGALLAAFAITAVATPSGLLATPFFSLDWFLLGMTLATVSVLAAGLPAEPRAIVLLRRHPGLVWAAAAAVYLVVCSQVVDPAGRPQHVLTGVFALLVVVPAVFAGDARSVVTRVLANRVLGWLGLVSYGIFLWHGPIVLALDRTSAVTLVPHGRVVTLAVLTLALTLVAATVSYYAVERPLLRLKERRPGAVRASRPAVAGEAGAG
ncbi:MAG TPA: acyltransferase [Candidatus Dormibacteraeota bacterium]|nr:acyltransferase [Candidatus Dormibacteraeota bacterium]